MVIARLMGGLGNQLFQYAAGRTIALANETVLKLDISTYETSPRGYRLDKYNIQAETASPGEVSRLTGTGGGKCGRLRRAIRARLHLQDRRVGRERHYHFDPAMLTAPDGVYLDGYWQTERYFNEIDDVIREELTPREDPDSANRAALSEISKCRSVSLHIRRGDYVSNPTYSKFHGLCPMDYYENAVRQISAEVEQPRFFIFSDDPEWVRENLKLDHPTTYINHNGEEKDYEDLRLMSACENHIIANSSFSWWGAWLCRNPKKVVIAPRKWFNDPSNDTKDLIPNSWRRL